MKEYTFTNNETEFIVIDINHLSGKIKAENLQRNILDSNPVLKLIRVKELL